MGKGARWEIRVREASEGGVLTPKALARVFDSVQDLVNLIGEDLAGAAPRFSGRGDGQIREALQLQVREIKQGSVIAVLGVPPQQTSLTGQKPTLADATFDRMARLFHVLSGPDLPTRGDIEEIIKDPTRQRQVLKHVEDMTSATGKYVVESRIGSHKATLDLRTRDRAMRLRLANPSKGDRILEGRITKMAVDKSYTIHVEPFEVVEGIESYDVRYPSDCEEQVRGLLGQCVRIMLNRKIKGKKYSFAEPGDVQSLSTIPVSQLMLGGRRLAINPPLAFEWDYDEAGYVVWRDDLSVLATGKRLPEVVAEVHAQLREIWDLYVEAPESELAPDALELRKHFRSLVGV